MKTITQREVDKLLAEKHAVHVYPKKKVVCVDGFKYFKLVKDN